MTQAETRPTVVIIHGSQGSSAGIRDGLAHRWVVLEPELSDAPSGLEGELGAILRDLAPPRYGVVGISSGASVAVRHALESPDRVAVLALVSPLLVRPAGVNQSSAEIELERRLGDIQCPTLAVFGQEDALIAPDAPRVYRERIPNCNVAFVYDAGHDIAAERPDALLNLLGDYLERRETFIVQNRSGVISP